MVIDISYVKIRNNQQIIFCFIGLKKNHVATYLLIVAVRMTNTNFGAEGAFLSC